MSKGGRLGLVALAVAIAIVAFAIAKPGDSEDDNDGTTAAQTSEQPTATAPSATAPPEDGPDAVPLTTVQLEDYAVVGEPPDIEATKGQTVRFVVRSDVDDSVHVHGYDIEREVGPGRPARFSFTADIEGIFEIESHEAEHNGKDPLIANLVIKPS
jgi:heme/copper-type cytochrome/quinol oxidase subunit 2